MNNTFLYDCDPDDEVPGAENPTKLVPARYAADLTGVRAKNDMPDLLISVRHEQTNKK